MPQQAIERHMIRFACRCSHVMELPDDQAGLSAQCPKCGLLLDVPALSDLAAIDQDGTYLIGEKPKPKSDAYLKQLTTIYYPGRQLPNGQEIDLRGSFAPEPEPQPAPEPVPVPAERPKYDPETGELIVPIDVDVPTPTPHPSELPTAQRVINYNIGGGDPAQYTVMSIGVFARLFQPFNLIVMGIIFLMHMAVVLTTMVAGIMFFIVFAPIAVTIALLGHYAMLIEEMGPGERDELPRPLREVHVYDDFIHPFAQMVFVLLLCYGVPAVMLTGNMIADLRQKPLPFSESATLYWALYAIGSLFVPALLQTLCTSGNLVNLRPDRVLGVIRATGFRYILIAALWAVAFPMVWVGQFAVLGNWLMMLGLDSRPPQIAQAYIAYPLLLGGIYLMHAFSWIMGLEYRRKHTAYPWALQTHIRKPDPVVRYPALNPKVSAAEKAAQDRAARRPKPQVR